MVPCGVPSRIFPTQAPPDRTAAGTSVPDGGSSGELCSASKDGRDHSDGLKCTRDGDVSGRSPVHRTSNNCVGAPVGCEVTDSGQSDLASALEARTGPLCVDDFAQQMETESAAEDKERRPPSEAQLALGETEPLGGDSGLPRATSRAEKHPDALNPVQRGKAGTKLGPRIEEVSSEQRGAKEALLKTEREEEERGENLGGDEVFRYTEDEEAPDSAKRRHTLAMPVGWGVTKPVAEATGNGGTFKKVIWVNETVGEASVFFQFCIEGNRCSTAGVQLTSTWQYLLDKQFACITKVC